VPHQYQQRNGNEEIRAPVTPNQRLRSIRSSRLLRISSAQPSPDGGILLGPSENTHTFSATDGILTSNGPSQVIATPSMGSDADPWIASPSKLANIRIRRCHNGSSLLQSPARAGHTARMKQIFEEAGREQHTPQVDKGVLYPQLPNISRKASPPPEHSQHHTPHSSPIRRPESLCMSNISPTRRPESLCMSTSPFRIVSQQPQGDRFSVSEQSSESWSDDSGYFVASSRNQTANLTVCAIERITDWLVSVAASKSEEGLVDPIGDERCDSRQSLQYAHSELDDYFSTKDFEHLPPPFFENYKSCPPLPPMSQDPFVRDENVTSGPSLFNRRQIPRPFPTTNSLAATSSTVIIRPHPSPIKRHNSAFNTLPLDSTPQRSPSKNLILEEGGVQLSPLSPNVCIERGPSRYHSAHRRSNADHTGTPTKEYILSSSPLSPNKEWLSSHLQVSPTREHLQVVAQLKENNAAGKGETERESPCKIGVGTRFQHPRHQAYGGSRWGRCGEL
jgi:hypothetical protein